MTTTSFDVERLVIGAPGGAPGTIMKPHWRRAYYVTGRNAKRRAIRDARKFNSESDIRWRVVKRTVTEKIIRIPVSVE